MISRRSMLAGGLALPALAGCGGQPTTQPTAYAPGQTRPGLDAVIDISHNVTVTSFAAVRRSNILAVIHKVTEGGDWFDPSYSSRRRQAEAAGLLWGGYHFGTGTLMELRAALGGSPAPAGQYSVADFSRQV